MNLPIDAAIINEKCQVSRGVLNGRQALRRYSFVSVHGDIPNQGSYRSAFGTLSGASFFMTKIGGHSSVWKV
jgi:hypothetical protein